MGKREKYNSFSFVLKKGISQERRAENMKVLFIGGTGTISTAITKALIEKDEEVWLLNRGLKSTEFDGKVNQIIADVSDEADVAKKIEGMSFDVVCDFIGFVPEQVERDYRLFAGKTKQYMYISSASAYNTPPVDHMITEGTTLANPYWEYSRNKIACEDVLLKHFREDAFPVTIIRPSHTFGLRDVPLGVHGDRGSYQVLKRMMEGKPVIIHGDGTSLWTMTFNEDFAKGFIGLMGNPKAIGEAFQITTEESHTWNQIYQIVANCLGVELKPYYVASDFLAAASDYDFTGSLLGDKSNTVIFDNTKLKNAVPGLNMNIRLEEGMKKTIDYVLSHKECQVEDPEFDKWCDDVIEALEAAKATIKSKTK